VLRESIRQIILKERASPMEVKQAIREMEMYAKSKGVYLELYLNKNFLMIGYIKRESGNKGVGAEVLKYIKSIAMAVDVPLGLDVDAPGLDSTTQDRLINYYRQQGFEFNHQEFKRDPDLGVYMTSGMERKPMMYWIP
jgi:hypothetical protein